MRRQAQCHGAVGIGQFLLRLHRVVPRGTYSDAVREAAATAEREMHLRTSAGLCHGVAGDGNFFLDCYRTLADSRFLEIPGPA